MPRGHWLWLLRWLNLECVAGFAVFPAIHQLSRNEFVSGVTVALFVVSLLSYFATLFIIARLERPPSE